MGRKTYQELLDLAEEEFVSGMRAMLHHLQREATCCNGTDNCLICNVGNKFLKRKEKEILGRK